VSTERFILDQTLEGDWILLDCATFPAKVRVDLMRAINAEAQRLEYRPHEMLGDHYAIAVAALNAAESDQ
jgi:hypothetical protein